MREARGLRVSGVSCAVRTALVPRLDVGFALARRPPFCFGKKEEKTIAPVWRPRFGFLPCSERLGGAQLAPEQQALRQCSSLIRFAPVRDGAKKSQVNRTDGGTNSPLEERLTEGPIPVADADARRRRRGFGPGLSEPLAASP